MNFPFKKALGSVIPFSRKSSGRLKAVWVRDPRTGRLVQTWQESDDGERSCSGRPHGPRFTDWTGGLKRAA